MNKKENNYSYSNGYSIPVIASIIVGLIIGIVAALRGTEPTKGNSIVYHVSNTIYRIMPKSSPMDATPNTIITNGNNRSFILPSSTEISGNSSGVMKQLDESYKKYSNSTKRLDEITRTVPNSPLKNNPSFSRGNEIGE